MDSLLWALAIAMNPVSDSAYTRRIDLKDERSPEIVKVAALRQLLPGDEQSPTLDTAERLINAWNKATPTQKLQPFVSMVPESKIFKRVSNTVTPVYLSYHKGWWYALAPRYLEPPGQTQPQVITVPEGRRVAPTQGPFNDGLAPPPPNVRFLYPKDAPAEEMERRPRVDLRKGLWGVSAMVVPPGATLKDDRDSNGNNEI